MTKFNDAKNRNDTTIEKITDVNEIEKMVFIRSIPKS